MSHKESDAIFDTMPRYSLTPEQLRAKAHRAEIENREIERIRQSRHQFELNTATVPELVRALATKAPFVAFHKDIKALVDNKVMTENMLAFVTKQVTESYTRESS